MMTQQFGFSILTAPLAAVDRRVLSQAWYSALHLAGSAREPKPAAGHLADIAFRERRAPVIAGDARPRGASVLDLTHGRRRPGTPTRATAPEGDRRAERSSLARRIERTFLNPRARVRRASFAIDGSGARIHVALQTHGNRVRLVAICPPSVRPIVAKALVQARFALSARGIDLAVEHREVFSC
jgi:hypothetical protein